ncbi:general secretion pathway protein I [Catenovulum agarivorans DS-2]|uniref:Type II secretion system protein I n=1 Tax=Catenovulum agarivorans DS-2 TaxID=1328313 RepID=W7R0V8_9ALTE|nr:type II secretion system minor pseudopilin GspI [Catenovulum agarivorans]EWH11235.1 general secretion pathway protein I [Catenovulum agarivorans DS-2]
MQQQRGFTILEVIVALALLATAGVAVVQSSAVHINSQDRLKNHIFATWVASNRLNEIQLENVWPVKAGHKGDVELAGHTWYWQQKVVKTAFGEEMIAVRVEVYRDAGYQEYVTELMTYIGKPQ